MRSFRSSRHLSSSQHTRSAVVALLLGAFVLAPLSAQTAQAAANSYKKNVYNAGTSTPAATVTAGSQVTYVVDLGAAAGNAEPTGTTTSLNDLLSAGHSGVTAPDLPDGWSSPVTAVPATNTTIGTWDVAANAAPIATYDNDVTAKPLMGSNAYAAGQTLYPKTTLLAGAGIGDGFAPFAYTTGTGKRQVLAINHHATGPSVPCLDYPSWASCYGTNTPLRLTDPGPTSGTGIATMPYSMYTVYYAKVGNRIYSPALLGKNAGGTWSYTDMVMLCVDVSGDVPVSCPTIDLPQTARDANTTRGVIAIGNYVYVGGAAPVAEGGGWRWWATDVSTGTTTVTSFANTNLYGGYAKDRHNVFMNPDRYATITDDGKVVCVDFDGPNVTNCADGSGTLTLYGSASGAQIGADALTNGASVFPIVAGGAVDTPNEIGVCGIGWTVYPGTAVVQNCFDYNMAPLPDRVFAPDASIDPTMVSNSYGAPVPNTTDFVAPNMWINSLSTIAYHCFDTSDTSASVSGGCGEIRNASYGLDFVTDTCLVSYDDPNIWRFYTYSKDYLDRTVWTNGCATPQSANGTQVTIPDPQIQHCGPGTSVITWDKTTLSNVPAFSGTATVQYYKADGTTLLDSTTFTNATAAATLNLTIPSTVKYATDPSIKVQIVWPETLSVTANTVVGIKVSHITSDGSGPQVCFAAVLPTTCPAAASSLNTASIIGSTLLAVNAASVPVRTSTGTAVTCAAPIPMVGLTKAANPTVVSGAGQTVTYTFVATNTGTAPLTNVGITDTLTLAGGTLSSISCVSLAGPAGACTAASSTSLAVGQSATFTATYVTAGVDITNGKITNSAVANASSVAGPATSAPATAQVDIVELVHRKSASPAVVTAVGQTVTYTFEVFNGGSRDLTGVSITDTLTQAGNPAGLSAITCSSVSAPGSCTGSTSTDLAAQGTAIFTATYVTTQQDLDNGSISNQATATGNLPTGGSLTSNLAQASVGVGRLSIAKSASPAVISAVGENVSYSIVVTNTGTTPMTNVSVTDTFTTAGDPAGLSPIACTGLAAPVGSCSGPTVPTLAVGQSATFKANYLAVAADLTNKSVVNEATATGTPEGTTTSATTAPTTATVNVAAITLVKSATPATFNQAPTALTYRFLVTNTGSVTLNPVVVSDPLPNLSAIDCAGISSLAAGSSMTCTATYSATSADLLAGSINNTATVTGTPPSGPAVTATSTASVPVSPQFPAISLVKSGSPATFSAPGTVITYSYLVDNIGDIRLDPIAVTDPMEGLSAISCPATALSPSDPAMICTATYITTQRDVDTGRLYNEGTATGTTLAGVTVKDTSEVIVPATQDPDISVVKTASVGSFVAAGAEVTYSYLVKNIGNVKLKNIVVTDPMPGLSPVSCPLTDIVEGATDLLVDGEITCTATYTTTTDDVANGSINNTATATGTSGTGAVVTDTSTVSIPVASYTVSKAASAASVVPGSTLTYTVTVTNTGGIAFAGATFDDDLSAVLDDASYNDDAVASVGSVSLTGSTLSWSGDLVYPSVPVTVTYSVTVNSPDEGDHKLTNTANPTVPGGFCAGGSAPVAGACPALVVPVASYTVSKAASAASVVPGSTVTYTVTVTNTGGGVFTGATFDDDLSAVLDDASYNNDAVASVGSASLTGSTLSWSGDLAYPSVPVTVTYSVTVNSPDEGDQKLTNAASPTTPGGFCFDGTAPVDGLCPAVVVPVTSFTVSKSASVSSAVPGATVTYTVTVTNTGGAPFAGATFTDALVAVLDDATYNSDAVASSGSVSVSGSTLSWSGDLVYPSVPVTITYSVTVNSPDTGDHVLTNAAVPTGPGGFCSDGSAPVDDLCAAVVVPVTTYVVSKAASVTSAVPGAKVTYTVTVTNTGGSAFTGATFTDALVGVLDDATYNADAVASSGSVSVSGSTLSWTGDLVYPSVPVTITYSVTVNSPDTGDHVLTNAAVPTGPGGFCSDGSAPVDGLCAPVLVPVTTYAVSKAASASSAVPGATVTYTVTVTNTGGGAFAGATFDDDLAGVLDDATYNSDAVASSGSVSLTGSTLSWTGDLAYPSVPVTITYSVTVNSPDTGDHVLSNAAVPTLPGGLCADGAALVDDTCPAVVVPVTTYTVAKAASVTSAVTGSRVTYTVTVTNTGGGAFTGATFADDLTGVLDDATYNDDAAASSGNVAVIGSNLSWSGDLVHPSVPVTITYSVTVNAPDTGDHQLVNAAVPTVPGGLCANGSAPQDEFCPAVIVPVRSFTVSKAASVTSVTTGSTVTYTVTVTNTGGTAFAGATFTDDLSGVLDDAAYNDDAMASSGTVSVSGSTPMTSRTLSWSGDLVYPSVPVTITYSVTVNAPDTGDHKLTNSAVPTVPGGFCADGSAPVADACPATVVPVTSYTVSKAASASSAVLGSMVTYTVTITNSGQAAFVGATFSDDLSAVLDDATYNADAVASSGAVSLSGSTLSWTGDLAFPSVPVTVTYSVTVKNPDPGDSLLTNAAVPTAPGGFCSDGSAPVADACPAVEVPVTSYTVSKAASVASAVPGTTVTYTVTVTNTGQAAFAGASLIDDLSGVLDDATYHDDASASSGSVSVTGSTLSWSGDLAYPSVPVTITYTVTVNAPLTGDQRLENAAVPTATGGLCSNGNPPVGDTCSSVVVPVKAYKVAKAASDSSVVPGGTVSYTVTVTNTGGAAFTGATFTDDLSGVLDDASYNADVMASSGTVSVTGSTLSWSGDLAYPSVPVTVTYSVTVRAPASGDLRMSNAAVPTVPDGTCSDGTAPLNDTCAPVVVPVQSLTVAKSASPASITHVGEQVTYTFVVTNKGTVPMTNVSVSDVFGTVGTPSGLSAITCTALATPVGTCSGTTLASLAVGQAATFRATYTSVAADLDNGLITNTATATGTPLGTATPVTSPSSEATVAVARITIVKSASPTTFSAVGATLSYSFLVSNTGTVPLTSVAVTDPLPGLSAIDCGGVTALGVGEATTCTATYSTTQDDLNAGSVKNTASAAATSPLGVTVTSTSDKTVQGVQSPAITLEKSASVASVSATGTTVTYSYRVKNTGDVLLGVSLTDPMVGLSAIDCGGVTSLAPGAEVTCTATYTTTQADLDAGHLDNLDNVATVTGTTVTGTKVQDTSKVLVPAIQSPGIVVDKTASIDSFTGPGTLVTYSYKVTNTGNVTLTGVGVLDPLPGLSSVSCPATEPDGSTSLAVGESITCTATYSTTEKDVDQGIVDSVATATGAPPVGSVVSDDDNEPIPAKLYTVTKTASATVALPGATVRYTVTVTNTGSMAYVGTSFTDDLAAVLDDATYNADAVASAGTVSVSGSVLSWTGDLAYPSVPVTITYSVTVKDPATGDKLMTNQAVPTAAGGACADGTPPVDGCAPVVVSVGEPTLSLVKSTSTTLITSVGQKVDLSYRVTNTGPVPVTGIIIVDQWEGPASPASLSAIVCPTTTLAPGETMVCTATYTVTQADLLWGKITGAATVTGTAPGSTTRTAPTPPSVVTVPTVLLASTGFDAGALGGFAAALIGLGLVGLLATSRRQH